MIVSIDTRRAPTPMTMNDTAIAWTNLTWNPATGCEKISEGCKYCLVPETPILYSDMTWRPIGNVRPGDRLVAFDEYRRPDAQHRKLREAVVQAVVASSKPT